jgi:hypothetical protein
MAPAYVVPILVLSAATLLGQSKPAASAAITGLELPVHLRQNVEAGKTPVGAKVQAKLDVATLVNGVVVPEGAILSGEVIESEEKSATEPSRLAIRMDSAQWKNGSSPMTITLASKVYLTAWYYPALPPTPLDPETMPDASQRRPQHRGGSAPYPDPNTADSPPYSRGNTGNNHEIVLAPAALQHRVPMPDLESVRKGDGSVTLTSKHSNIKLNRSTTYVLAAGDILPIK